MESVIIKPIITEKITGLTEKFNRYGFWVERAANKIEIKKAVEKLYGVTVVSVNTIRIGGGKEQVKYTNRGVAKANIPLKKKAIVTLKEGDVIDLYANI